jgi:MYXO-CTERM domain-containing protein
MRQFYANLRDGEPLDLALQHAKLTFLHAAGPTSRPFFWASFIATGDGRAIVRTGTADTAPRRSSVYLWLLILAAAAAIVAVRRRMSAAGTAVSPAPTRQAP